MFYYWQQKVEMYETKIIFSSFWLALNLWRPDIL
jgi:hypothetical protein